MVGRVRVARKAIMELREKHPNEPIAVGAVGILDFVESGEIDKILDGEIRSKIMAIVYHLDTNMGQRV